MMYREFWEEHFPDEYALAFAFVCLLVAALTAAGALAVRAYRRARYRDAIEREGEQDFFKSFGRVR